MKKSIYRLKDYIESHKCNIYLIANDGLVGDIYRGYVEDELKTDNYIAVIRETNMYSAMNNITNKDKECVIILCGNWYKNPLVRKHNLLDTFSNNKCYTIPIDGIEKSPVKSIITTNTFQYEVWTRDKRIAYLCSGGFDLKSVIEIWNEESKGYNFMIAIKSHDESIGYVFYSVDYFNNYIVGNKVKDDITITSIQTTYNCESAIVLSVNYKYKSIKHNIKINTQERLSEEDIKKYIREEINKKI